MLDNADGLSEGALEGILLGITLGSREGYELGSEDGPPDGKALGIIDGDSVRTITTEESLSSVPWASSTLL